MIPWWLVVAGDVLWFVCVGYCLRLAWRRWFR